jgi:hypothetical protein
MWIARPGVDTSEIAPVLSAARDEGTRVLGQIAAREASVLQISGELSRRYLGENLHFKFGRRERQALRKFYQLCVVHGLAPAGLESAIDSHIPHDCPAS